MIVSGTVSKITYEDNKKVHIEVKINKILAICFDGKNLIDDGPMPYYKNTNQTMLDQQFINSNLEFYRDLSKYNLTGFIRKHDVKFFILKKIFDNKIPHLNDDLDAQLKEGVNLNCLIVRNKLSELKYKNEKFMRDDFLQLSLKNTIIKSAKQYFVHDFMNKLGIPLFLGISQLAEEKGKWIDDGLILKDQIYNNEILLSNLMKDFDIKQYGLCYTGVCSYKQNNESGYSYER
jgi:hypothetical protein